VKTCYPLGLGGADSSNSTADAGYWLALWLRDRPTGGAVDSILGANQVRIRVQKQWGNGTTSATYNAYILQP
jgi:hypothetical protein